MGGRSYSQDLRSRVLASDALSARQVAVRFQVSVSYVIKARQRLDRTGEVGTLRRGSRRSRVLMPYDAALAARVASHPSATLAELRSWLAADHGVLVGLTTVCNTLRQPGLTLKEGIHPAKTILLVCVARANLDHVQPDTSLHLHVQDLGS